MSQNLEMPDNIYNALSKAAEASGMTPVAWIAAHLSTAAKPDTAADAGKKSTMADRMAGRIGRVRSGGTHRLSEATGDKFTDYLITKKQAGHL